MTAGDIKKIYVALVNPTPEFQRMYAIVKHFADDLPISDLMLKRLQEDAQALNV